MQQDEEERKGVAQHDQIERRDAAIEVKQDSEDEFAKSKLESWNAKHRCSSLPRVRQTELLRSAAAQRF